MITQGLKRCITLLYATSIFLCTTLYAESQYFVEDGDALDWFQTFQISQKLYEGQSSYQKILVFDSPLFGRVLSLGGIVQLTEKDDPFYHEMLVHVPMLAHGAAKSVLIIGGGDGGCLREVLRHRGVKKAVMVELDKQVVEVCRKYIPSVSRGAFDDTRAQIYFQNGVDYVNTTSEKFDIIFADSTDPDLDGPGTILFSSDFYKSCKKILNPNGILITQNGIVFQKEETCRDIYKNLSEHFKEVRFYTTSVPCFIGGLMTFGWATDNPAHYKTAIKQLNKRMSALGGTMHYYTPEMHKAAFVLPGYIKNALK